MFSRYVSSWIAFSLLVGVGSAQEKPKPLGAPPQVVRVSEVNKGAGVVKLDLTLTQLVVKHMPVTRLIEVAGVAAPVTELVPVTIREASPNQSITLSETKLFDGEGKPLKVADAIDILQVGNVVVTFPAGTQPDPAYFALFKKRTVLLVLPTPKTEPKNN